MPPATFTPAPLFSGRVRVAVLLLNVGAELLAPIALVVTALADLPEPSASV